MACLGVVDIEVRFRFGRLFGFFLSIALLAIVLFFELVFDLLVLAVIGRFPVALACLRFDH